MPIINKHSDKCRVNSKDGVFLNVVINPDDNC